MSLILLMLFKFTFIFSQQQNLIPNPSFEERSSCNSNSENSFNHIKDWFNPNIVSPDFFHSCVNLSNSPQAFRNLYTIQGVDYEVVHVGVPRNGFGFQYPKTGDGYAGFICGSVMKKQDGTYYFNTNMVTEYIAVKLINKLNPGKKYCISAYVSPAEGYTYLADSIYSGNGAFNRLGVSFSEFQMQFNTIGIIVNPPSEIVHLYNEDQGFIMDTTGWENINGVYTANGNEQYLYIGNYDQPNQMNYTYIGTKPLYTDDEGNYDIYGFYYFIDDVSLVELKPALPLISQTKICKGQSITLSTDDWTDELEWVDESTGQIIGTSNNMTHSPEVSTSYLLRSKLCNIVFEERISIEVEQIEIKAALPEISATHICIGQSITLNTDGWAEELEWVIENTGQIIGTSNSINHSPIENTTYLLRSKLCDTEFEEKISVSVCQTPIAIHNTATSDYIYLQYLSENRNEPLVLYIFDSRGRLLKQINLPQGANSQYPINISELAEGVYHCRVMQGKEVLYFEKIVKLN